MNVAVVGLGSMGRRRIRLIQKYCTAEGVGGWGVVGVDTDPGRRLEASAELGVETRDSLEDALGACDAVVVSTPPLSHPAIIEEALGAGKHVFTEINLVPDGYERAMALARDKKKTLFLSSTFLYREEPRYIADAVAAAGKGTYRYHVGQYLPDWHPWEDYRSFFVADARTDACRELFAIELPWLQKAFGPVSDVRSARRKVSGLDLPYDDAYSLILEHESGTVGVLQVDVVCRKAVRDFEFSNEDLYLTWDGSASGLRRLDLGSGQMEPVDLYGGDAEHRDGYADFVVENAYYDELSAFFRAIATGEAPEYGFEEDLATLRLIDRIEGAE